MNDSAGPADRTVVVDGLGAVGMRAARELAGTPGVAPVVLRSGHSERLAVASDALGDRVRPWRDGDELRGATVVIARDDGAHVALAREHLRKGRHVVSCADDPDTIRDLLELESDARDGGVSLVVGAAFSPGLSCLLVRHAANALTEVTSIRVAMVGAGGPSCHQHRTEALGGVAPALRESEWVTPPSGTELVWFPDPLQALDVGPGALAEPLLIHRGLPLVPTVTALGAVERRVAGGRLPARLRPRRPQSEPLGAIRVEVVGRHNGEETMIVYAVVDRPAVAAGATAAVAALHSADLSPGAMSLAEIAQPLPWLAELARRGVKAATFEPAT